MPKTLIFAVAGFNLGETSKPIEIAKACREKFRILFISYGGKFEALIEDEGFELKKMEPRLTEQKLDQLERMLRGQTLNSVGYLSKKELAPCVENEIRLFKEIKPAAVLTGWCLSVTLSTRAVKIPFVNVLQSTCITEYYEAGLQPWPDLFDFGFLQRLFSEEKLSERFSKRVLQFAAWLVKPYNAVGEKYGLKKFRNFVELVEGDYTLLADIPELVGLPKIRPNMRYIGPLVYKSNKEIPKEINEMPRDKPIVYFAMGSSGCPKIIASIMAGFKYKPYRVIAPVKSLIKDMNLEIPSNVVVTDWLPAHKVNPMADISVIHGGQNTVMNACLSGTPIVGIGNHPEQQANLDACVRKGFAIRIKKKRVTASRVLDAIDTLLNDSKAKEEVKKFQKELMKWDGPANAAKFLYETFGE